MKSFRKKILSLALASSMILNVTPFVSAAPGDYYDNTAGIRYTSTDLDNPVAFKQFLNAIISGNEILKQLDDTKSIDYKKANIMAGMEFIKGKQDGKPLNQIVAGIATKLNTDNTLVGSKKDETTYKNPVA